MILGIYVLQTALIYSAIVLFVICFTILALKQLYDAEKYKYCFQVLRNMVVEVNHIHRLVLKQLMLWFGVLVCLAIVLAGGLYLFVSQLFYADRCLYRCQKVITAGIGHNFYLSCIFTQLLCQHIDIV